MRSYGMGDYWWQPLKKTIISAVKKARNLEAALSTSFFDRVVATLILAFNDPQHLQTRFRKYARNKHATEERTPIQLNKAEMFWWHEPWLSNLQPAEDIRGTKVAKFIIKIAEAKYLHVSLSFTQEA